MLNEYHKTLLNPAKLWSRDEILKQKPCPIPAESGVYAWYFKQLPANIPSRDCHSHNDLTLLYVGISPSRPESSNTLRKRIKHHLRGNAYGSTLRLSLGCLLGDELGIQLCRMGRGNRKTFGSGEGLLSDWIAQNAFVIWTVHPEPWHLEDELIRELSLPLNLRGNERHPFYPELAELRKRHKVNAV
jgi:hypothetical protein